MTLLKFKTERVKRKISSFKDEDIHQLFCEESSRKPAYSERKAGLDQQDNENQ